MKKLFAVLSAVALVGAIAQAQANIRTPKSVSTSGVAAVRLCEEPYTAPYPLTWDPHRCVWLRGDDTPVEDGDWPDAPENVIFMPAGYGANYSRYMLASG